MSCVLPYGRCQACQERPPEVASAVDRDHPEVPGQPPQLAPVGESRVDGREPRCHRAAAARTIEGGPAADASRRDRIPSPASGQLIFLALSSPSTQALLAVIRLHKAARHDHEGFGCCLAI